jgi:hypothetical protein
VRPNAHLPRLVSCISSKYLRGESFSKGRQASLPSGAVIGSASDLDAIYYNPGMLAVNRDQGSVLGPILKLGLFDLTPGGSQEPEVRRKRRI